MNIHTLGITAAFFGFADFGLFFFDFSDFGLVDSTGSSGSGSDSTSG